MDLPVEIAKSKTLFKKKSGVKNPSITRLEGEHVGVVVSVMMIKADIGSYHYLKPTLVVKVFFISDTKSRMGECLPQISHMDGMPGGLISLCQCSDRAG